MTDPTNPQTWVSVIQALGFPTIVAGYFMYRDYKLSQRQTDAMEKVSTHLAVLIEKLDREDDDA